MVEGLNLASLCLGFEIQHIYISVFICFQVSHIAKHSIAYSTASCMARIVALSIHHRQIAFQSDVVSMFLVY